MKTCPLFANLSIWILGTACFFSTSGPGRASDNRDLSAKLSLEAGILEPPAEASGLYQFSRLLLESHNDLQPSLALVLSGELGWQSSNAASAPPWLVYPTQNLLNLEADNLATSGGLENLSARLSRAYLQWVSGRLQVNAGLQSFDWGTSSLYRPTDYFFPLAPLAWVADQPLGSEGVEADCFLFDFLSAEGAVRWLQGGEKEWVARLVNKGIGIGVSPSFARMSGRDGLGVELSGTFPEFQARLEAVDWFYHGGPALLEWVAGLSTVQDKTHYTLEAFQDGTGSVLGGFSNKSRNAFYLFASVGKDFSSKWKVSAALVKSPEGGPLLIWPKASWVFADSEELTLQCQVPLLVDPGPLDLATTRLGLSAAYLY